MLRTGGQNEQCHKYLLLKLMLLVAIYKKAVQREHSVSLLQSLIQEQEQHVTKSIIELALALSLIHI